MLACPACESPLTPLRVGSLALDACAACGGLWFDARELDALDEAHEAPDAAEALDLPRDPAAAVTLKDRRSCPRCEETFLYSRRYAPASAVTVDHCPGCGGFWLDSGELEAIRSEFGTAEEREAVESTAADSAAVELLVSSMGEMEETRGLTRLFRFLGMRLRRPRYGGRFASHD